MCTHLQAIRANLNSISRCTIRVSFFLLGFIFWMNGANAQKVRIVLGNGKIGINEIYTITLTATDQTLADYSNFPNIDGFTKAGTSSSSSMGNFNGSVTSQTSIIQNYMPSREGSFTLPPFTMKVDGVAIKSPGAVIKVGPPVDQKRADPFGADPFAYDPFEDFFGGARRSDIKDVKADAFLNMQVDKRELWVGEGLNVTLSFLVSEENRAELDFYDLGNQLATLVKKIKPANCWEENFGIEEIVPHKVIIGKKNYTEYRIYQATLFPLVAKSFTIPALTLNMVKYNVGSAANFFGAPRKQEVKGFTSKPVSVEVKDLPPHPQKGKVSVGKFKLEEKVGASKVTINQGVAIDLLIKGEGNIAYIPEPAAVKNEFVDLYPPNTRQTIQRAGGRVTGEKTFSYLMVPKERGTVYLENIFNWVYFNTDLARYDTLRPNGTVAVMQGKELTARNSATSQNSFYSKIDQADRDEISEKPDKSKWLLWANISIGAMALVTLWLSFRK